MRWPCIISGILIVGCTSSARISQGLPREADAFARRFIALIASGEIAAARNFLHPEIRGAVADSGLVQMQREMKGQMPIGLRLVRYEFFELSGRQTYLATYEGRADSAWVLYFIRVSESGGELAAEGAHVQVRSASLAVENALTLRDKSPAHYIFVLAALSNVGFILLTLFRILRTPDVVKWRWMTAAVFGFGTFHLNWTTGERAFNEISVVLFGAALIRSDHVGPWVLQVGIPVGALLFYVRTRSDPAHSRG